MKLLFVFTLMLFSCEEAKQKLSNFQSSNELCHYHGRSTVLENEAVALIGSAASVEFNVKGDAVNLYLQTESLNRNYYVISVNDKYKKRYKIEGDSIQKIALKLPNSQQNKIGIYKATEAYNDRLVFYGVDAEALLPMESKPLEIEFIGDSITCGALSDNSDLPCNEGDYQDQHNAYLAYGPQLAKRLQADFVVSAVSGIGMYRNWNTENENDATMPEVYDRLYLSADNSTPFQSTSKPDIVSVCLGTNDLSDGDGVKERLPFSKEKFTTNYIQFVQGIYKRYPATKIVLLNSPMLSGEKQYTLVSCLKQVQEYFKTEQNKDIALFEFENTYLSGCNSHPSTEDHNTIVTVLEPYFKTLLNIEK
ncbi:GDSL family lipase [Winogradskyella sp. F6397]|uniref:GDSL family lipase n=1 Tax=Winogradskyella marina TaxID=2785530 RepID=A0ABS0EDQ9_9FLAO|nr:SGNH/GDSL hydrolase family protein [Winogradskyella marina]MBF8148582.1 GDSL family lipase [Winogradskyella marina]